MGCKGSKAAVSEPVKQQPPTEKTLLPSSPRKEANKPQATADADLKATIQASLDSGLASGELAKGVETLATPEQKQTEVNNIEVKNIEEVIEAAIEEVPSPIKANSTTSTCDGSSLITIGMKAEFMQRFGHIYEESPRIAEEAWEQLSATKSKCSASELVSTTEAIVLAFSMEQKLALLQSYPDLAGKLSLCKELTDFSEQEHKSAGLDQCSPEELEEFTRLNATYVAKFEFPFLLAITGYTRQGVLHQFRARIANTRDAEFATALSQVVRIAEIRVNKA